MMKRNILSMAGMILLLGSLTGMSAATENARGQTAPKSSSEFVQLAQNTTGTIKLKKLLVPNNATEHFNLFIKDSNGAIVPNGQMQNAGNNTTLGPVTVPAGNYSVSETPGWYTVGSDYTSAISGAGCNANGTVNVIAGSNITCTITNSRNPPGFITVKKITVPAVDPGRFTLQITNSYPHLLANFLNAGGGATMGPVSLPSGSTYTINEIAGTGTNLANYTQTITGAGCTNGIVNLTAGANIVCTITNTNTATCTGYPLQATVDIQYTGISSAQQTVHICRGGKVKFVNHTSTAVTAHWLSGITSFANFLVTIGGNALTPVLPVQGSDSYNVSGSSINPGAPTAGTIVIH